MDKLDDSLYSRQRCVLGEDAMENLQASQVFISGLGGVAIEIAKNLILSGIKGVYIQDDDFCSNMDLGVQFFIRHDDIASKSRSEACLPRLSALNPNVSVIRVPGDIRKITGDLNSMKNAILLKPLLIKDELGQQIKCLIVTQCDLRAATLLNLFCRQHKICFIYTDVYGVLGNVFCDFGPQFFISDPRGEPPEEFFVGHVQKLGCGRLLLRTLGDKPHHLQTGDVIELDDICGMDELNSASFAVTVTSNCEFTIESFADDQQDYTGGGFARQVIQVQEQYFAPLIEQIRHPSIYNENLSSSEEGNLLHVIFLTLNKFRNEEGRFPEPWNPGDWATFHAKFSEIEGLLPLGVKIGSYEQEFVFRIAFASRGQLPPLCSFFGALAAQEAIKYITSVFTPFNQWFYMHCDSVVPRKLETNLLSRSESRYDSLVSCIGPDCLKRIQHMSALVVGCGAIGCELLKNLTLLGFASGGNQQDAPSLCTMGQHEGMQTALPVGLSGPVQLENPHSLFPSANPLDNPDGDRTNPIQKNNRRNISPTSTNSENIILPSPPIILEDNICPVPCPEDNKALAPSSCTNPLTSSSGEPSPSQPVMSGFSADIEMEPISASDDQNTTSPVIAAADTNRCWSVTNVEPYNLSGTIELLNGNGEHTEVSQESGTSPNLLLCQPSTMEETLTASSGIYADIEPVVMAASDSSIDVSSYVSCHESYSHESPAVPANAPNTTSPLLTVTDPDVVDRCNLSTQFLYQLQHVGLSKSAVAAAVVRAVNPRIQIRELQHQVAPATERTVFTDEVLLHSTGNFKCSSDNSLANGSNNSSYPGPIIGAVDCLSVRHYLDTRAVSLRLPFFDSGILGTKGHVQVILPGLTESYNSHPDGDGGIVNSADYAESLPHCTLKSFPTRSIHCIEWAREKFFSLFSVKPDKMQQFFKSLSLNHSNEFEAFAQYLLDSDDASSLTEAPTAALDKKISRAFKKAKDNMCTHLNPTLFRYITSLPTDWAGCVRLARDKFQRYFNHKARQLLLSFPPSTTQADGTLFWQSPKRQPNAIEFDSTEPLHRLFVVSCARILAVQLQVPVPDELRSLPLCAVTKEQLMTSLTGYSPPPFFPSVKPIVTDETVQGPKSDTAVDGDSATGSTEQSMKTDEDSNFISIHKMVELFKNLHKMKTLTGCLPTTFETDNDSLYHIDFISAAANLRASMYNLPLTPRYIVRRIAGRILPAMVTTAAAVGGLVALEMIKYACRSLANSCLDDNSYGLPQNTFMNLALPLVVMSEPAACVHNKLPNQEEFSLWDRWDFHIPEDYESDNYLLDDFMEDLKNQHNGLEITMVVQGSRMVYVNYMPTHNARRRKPFLSLLTYEPADKYVDLMVAYAPPVADDDFIEGPPVRFHFAH